MRWCVAETSTDEHGSRILLTGSRQQNAAVLAAAVSIQKDAGMPCAVTCKPDMMNTRFWRRFTILAQVLRVSTPNAGLSRAAW